MNFTEKLETMDELLDQLRIKIDLLYINNLNEKEYQQEYDRLYKEILENLERTGIPIITT